MNEINHSDERPGNLEQKFYAKFRDELKPPHGLQVKVIQQLKQKQLIHAPMKKTNFYWAAAVLAALIAGFFFGKTDFNATPETVADTKAQFLLLLYEDESFNAEHPASLVQEYTDWAREMHAEDQLAYAEKLGDEKFGLGKVPEANASNITGYFVIKASSLDEARRIANGHPHLKYNGGIELRPIDNIN
jgi:hypothetical protein